MIEARRFAKNDQVVARTAKPVASGEALTR